MIKQAHTYLVGALSGVTLIGIAIAVFVVLVSAQVFHEWPIADVGSPPHREAALSPAKALPPGDGATASTSGGATRKATRPHGGHVGATATAPTTNTGAAHQGTAADPGVIAEATGPATAVKGSPTTGGGGTRSPGGRSGSHPSQPSSNSSSPSPSSSESGSTPGSTSGTSGSSGSTGTSGSSGGATGSSGSTGGGSGTGTGTGTGAGTGTGGGPTEGPVTATTKPSQTITETVNGTVGTVNEATGGALEKTGVTEATEKVVESVAGPESVVGKTVDEVTETLTGLLGGGGH